MQVLTDIHVLETLCRLTGKWGMYISWYMDEDSTWEDLYGAAPYLRPPEYAQPVPPFSPDPFSQVLADEHGWILFDTEEEMREWYDQTVGDDGPTATNLYSGPMRVYAITCRNDGQTLDENT